VSTTASRRAQLTPYAWYVLTVLLVVYTCNWMDRYVLIILLESIKHDLHLSDTALGLLSGFVFASIYSVAGIVIARIADRTSRRGVISLGLAVWSLMTATSALAANFLQLATARFGVALGESACSPAASSLIADYFPPERRATAFAVYGVGISIGMGLGLSIGGWANEAYGWRSAFLIVGLPGLLLALLVRLTVREPRRGQVEGAAVDAKLYGAGDAVRALLARKSFLPFAFGLGLFSFSGMAFEIWTPVYLIRSYHLSSTVVGNLTGFTEAVAGLIGTMGGGLIADRLGRRDLRWYLWGPAAAAVLMTASMLVFLHTAGSLMLVFYFLWVMCAGSYLAPIVAVTHRIMPLHMRALATAVLYLLLNLIGPGAGPLVTGMLNDLFSPSYGAEAVRLSLMVNLLGTGCGIALMIYSANHVLADLRLADEGAETAAPARAALDA